MMEPSRKFIVVVASLKTTSCNYINLNYIDLPYEQALALQARLTQGGEKGWLFFSPPPTLTLGVRGRRSDILVSDEVLEHKGIAVLTTDRGGQVTYHGPTQCVGFPMGRLTDFVTDPRGVRVFIQKLQEGLQEFVKEEWVRLGFSSQGLTLQCSTTGAQAGLWVEGSGFAKPRKLVSFGLKFFRTGISHGFALNMTPDDGFQFINPCGEAGAQPFSLYESQSGLYLKERAAVWQSLFERLKAVYDI